jgi:tRNA-specific 2-thiouridylase
MTKKVILGLSGGVDSSVAAYLLIKEGYDVEAVFMKNWEGDDSDEHCSAEADLSDAIAVAKKLNIPLHTANFSNEYWDNVFSHFLDEYKKGRTPNPDILCNKEIKFKAFLDYALKKGADYIATGHYVQRRYEGDKAQLLKAKDRKKDQTYFLYAISQNALAKTLFPVGAYQKSEIRQIALDQGLITHNKKDSTGICFIGERRFTPFLKEYLLTEKGPIETPNGQSIGEHDGLMYYTIGQRQGLNIGGVKGADDAPWYVVDKNIKENKLIIAQGDHPLLYSQGLLASSADWFHKPNFPLQCYVKTRYRQDDIPALVTETEEDQYCVMFSDPVRAITPGQSIVFYHKTQCLGGAVIDAAIR